MILQALVKYYEDMAAKDKVPSYGWGIQNVSYALYLNEEGTLCRIVSVKREVETEKKKKKEVEIIKSWVPRTMKLPAAVKRSVNIASNFLWDNVSYLLGFDNKENPERAKNCFEACRKLHEQLLENVEAPEGKALLQFFKNWEPSQAEEHLSGLEDGGKEELTEIMGGANLVFRYIGNGQITYLHEVPEIREAWQRHCTDIEGKETKICLVTGQKATVAVLHPSIKGIPGAQSSGASLVSYNAPAFCSYGQEQGYNAPTSEYAAFAYGTALNHLISQKEFVHRIGDTTVLCWADGAEEEYPGLMGYFLFGDDSSYTEKELNDMLTSLIRGKSVQMEEQKLDPAKPFYILGISPNAARLSVRFFLRNSFGKILENAQAHQERLRIQRPSSDQFETIPLWKLLNETVNQNAKEKTVLPKLAGEVLEAVLKGTPYPATLLHGVLLRIRAEHKITRGRAAIIKAYYLKNPNKDIPEKEVLTVSLNKESNNIPYQLGRLFSILEGIQSTANPGLNSTIRDKYFNAASATPAAVFPVLVNLAQKHLKKIGGEKKGLQIKLEKQLEEVMNRLGEAYPSKLNLPQQGAFQLGYYQQTIVRYEPKETEQNEEKTKETP